LTDARLDLQGVISNSVITLTFTKPGVTPQFFKPLSVILTQDRLQQRLGPFLRTEHGKQAWLLLQSLPDVAEPEPAETIVTRWKGSLSLFELRYEMNRIEKLICYREFCRQFRKAGGMTALVEQFVRFRLASLLRSLEFTDELIGHIPRIVPVLLDNLSHDQPGRKAGRTTRILTKLVHLYVEPFYLSLANELDRLEQAIVVNPKFLSQLIQHIPDPATLCVRMICRMDAPPAVFEVIGLLCARLEDSNLITLLIEKCKSLLPSADEETMECRFPF
jgi:hypothetical protein